MSGARRGSRGPCRSGPESGPVPGDALASGEDVQERDDGGAVEEAESVGNGDDREPPRGALEVTDEGRSVEDALQQERPVIERPASETHVADQGGREEKRSEKAETLVRHGLQPETVPQGVQHPALAREHLEVPRDG